VLANSRFHRAAARIGPMLRQRHARAKKQDERLMAKEPNDEKSTPQNAVSDGQKAPAGNGAQPNLSVLAQYIKDFSFESPGAPKSLLNRESAPAININVNVNANPLEDKDYDVILTLSAKAEADKTVLFNVELVYGGVFRIDGFPKEHMLPLL